MTQPVPLSHSVTKSCGIDRLLKTLVNSVVVPRSHGFREVLTANFKITGNHLPESVGPWDGQRFPSKYQRLVGPALFWDRVGSAHQGT
jgi:hypothetical protein